MERIDSYMNHVVLADDDQDHGFLFKRVLKEVDPTKSLTIIKDGEELMNFLSQQVPGLLFLDLNMPCKHGLECLREIREHLGLRSLPIVVYSGSTQMTDIQKSFIHNADLYMVKPFNSFHLKNALQSVLNMDWRKKPASLKLYFINNRFVPFTA